MYEESVRTVPMPRYVEKETAREGKNEATRTELPRVDNGRNGNLAIKTVPALDGCTPRGIS